MAEQVEDVVGAQIPAGADKPPLSDEVRASMAAVQKARATAVARARRATVRTRAWFGAMLGTVALGLIVFGLAGGRQVATPTAAVAASLPVANTPPVALPTPPPVAPSATPEPSAGEPVVVEAPAALAVPTSPVTTAAVTATAVRSHDADNCRAAAGQPRWRVDVEACSRIFEGRPNDAALALTIAHAHHAKGHIAQSGEWARRAIALDSHAAEAFVILAGAEARAGHPTASVQAYRSYLGLVPRGWHAPEARAAVRRSDEHARKPSRLQSASSDAEGG